MKTTTHLESHNACTWESISDIEKRALVDQVLKDYDYEPTSLIQILHIVQNIYGYLPLEIQSYIAEKTDLSLSHVSGVISFYTLFLTKPKGKYVVKICLGTACYVRGGRKIIERIEHLLDTKLGETSVDGNFSIEITRCIGACGLAPALSINGKVFMQVKSDRLKDILDPYIIGEVAYDSKF